MYALFDIPTPRMDTFDASRCTISDVSYDTARQVIAEAHYIGRPGATSIALGMYVDQVIAGVITFGTIPRNNAVSICGDPHAAKVMELTRLALYDWPPTNSESWFIAQAFRWIKAHRPDIAIVISYADSSVGHNGTIYQATNFVYTGASTSDYVYEQEDGTVIHPRTTGRTKGELPPGRWIPTPSKHRYVTFIGPERKYLRRALRWEPLPYPKASRQEAA